MGAFWGLDALHTHPPTYPQRRRPHGVGREGYHQQQAAPARAVEGANRGLAHLVRGEP